MPSLQCTCLLQLVVMHMILSKFTTCLKCFMFISAMLFTLFVELHIWKQPLVQWICTLLQYWFTWLWNIWKNIYTFNKITLACQSSTTGIKPSSLFLDVSSLLLTSFALLARATVSWSPPIKSSEIWHPSNGLHLHLEESNEHPLFVMVHILVTFPQYCTFLPLELQCVEVPPEEPGIFFIIINDMYPIYERSPLLQYYYTMSSNLF